MACYMVNFSLPYLTTEQHPRELQHSNTIAAKLVSLLHKLHKVTALPV